MRTTFVGLELPPDVRGRLSVLQFLLPLPQKVEPANFHLTLAYLGSQPDALLEAAHEALSAQQMPMFSMQLQGVGLFGGAKPRAVWAGVAPNPVLARLEAKLSNALRRAGLDLEARRFVPHVTVGRFNRVEPEVAMRLERAVVEHMNFSTQPFAIREFCLFQSHPGRDGPRYEVLARYGLLDMA